MTSHRPLTFWQKTKIAFAVLFHKHTPFSAKAAIGVGVLYGLIPIDVIPDFLPLIGSLDDAAIIIAVVVFFLKATKALRKDLERHADVIDIKPY